MATTVNTHEARTHLSWLMERAVAGEEIIIAKAGEPRVSFVPLRAGGERRPGRLAGLVVVPDAFFAELRLAILG